MPPRAFGHGAHGAAGGDGEDGHVRGVLDLLQDLVEGELGKRVAAGGDQDDVFVSIDAAETVFGLIEGVEEVGFLPHRNLHRADGLQDLALVLRKVGDDLRVHVEGHEGHVVLRPQLTGKGIRCIEHVVGLDPPIAVCGKLAEHQRRDGSLGALEAGDLLLHAILVDAEVAGLEIGHELAGLFQQHAHIHGHLGNVDVQGEVGHSRGVFELGSGRRRRRRVVGILLLLGQRNHPVVAAGAAGFGRGLVRLLGLLTGGRRRLGRGRLGQTHRGAGQNQKSQNQRGRRKPAKSGDKWAQSDHKNLLTQQHTGFERFSNSLTLTGRVEGGFFLRKKPLSVRGLGAHQLENRCSRGERQAWSALLLWIRRESAREEGLPGPFQYPLATSHPSVSSSAGFFSVSNCAWASFTSTSASTFTGAPTASVCRFVRQ